MGIDQANKGQVLGQIIVTACYSKHSNIEYQGESKSWKKDRVDEIPLLLKSLNVNYICHKITLEDLAIHNVNFCITKAMGSLLKLINPKVAYVDSHYSNPVKLKKELASYVPFCELIVTHNLDKTNTLVGLASLAGIFEKKKAYSYYESVVGPVGSGNLADPLTKKYILNTYPFTKFLKTKWSLKCLGL